MVGFLGRGSKAWILVQPSPPPTGFGRSLSPLVRPFKLLIYHMGQSCLVSWPWKKQCGQSVYENMEKRKHYVWSLSPFLSHWLVPDSEPILEAKLLQVAPKTVSAVTGFISEFSYYQREMTKSTRENAGQGHWTKRLRAKRIYGPLWNPIPWSSVVATAVAVTRPDLVGRLVSAYTSPRASLC